MKHPKVLHRRAGYASSTSSRRNSRSPKRIASTSEISRNKNLKMWTILDSVVLKYHANNCCTKREKNTYISDMSLQRLYAVFRSLTAVWRQRSTTTGYKQVQNTRSSFWHNWEEMRWNECIRVLTLTWRTSNYINYSVWTENLRQLQSLATTCPKNGTHHMPPMDCLWWFPSSQSSVPWWSQWCNGATVQPAATSSVAWQRTVELRQPLSDSEGAHWHPEWVAWAAPSRHITTTGMAWHGKIDKTVYNHI